MSVLKGSQTWLHATVDAVRELMEKRLAAHPQDSALKRDVEMALEELDVMWEELEGQAERLVRESARYAEFFEYAPDAYLVTDIGGTWQARIQPARGPLIPALFSVRAIPLAKKAASAVCAGCSGRRSMGRQCPMASRSLPWRPPRGD